jgi:AraC-like DNA-binding protein
VAGTLCAYPDEPTNLDPVTTEFARHPTLPVEARRSCQTNTCYRPHSHTVFSVGLIDAGRSVFSGAGCPTRELSPGDTIIIPAGCVHSCNPRDGRWLYRMIHMDADWVASLLPADTRSDLLHRVRVLHDPLVHDGFRRFTDVLFEDDTADNSAETMASLLRELLTHCTDAGEELRVRTSSPDDRVSRVLELLQDAATSPTVPDSGALAATAGLSPTQLCRTMKRATGLTPVAWRQNERVNRARRMIRDGRPLADTAAELGFSDQSHLTRVFRAHVAASPGEYRG